jgi:hypothetical protein
MRFIARNPKLRQLSHWTRPRAGGLPAEMSANGGKPLSVAAYLRGPTSEALLRIFDFDAALPLYSEGLRLLDNSISEPQRKREVSSTEAPPAISFVRSATSIFDQGSPSFRSGVSSNLPPRAVVLPVLRDS